jgi:hypothetical protein
MDGFSHVPTKSVGIMFSRVIGHFEEIKKIFTTFEISHGSPLFQ